MSDFLYQLSLPSEYSEETLYVRKLKEALIAMPEVQGKRLCVTYKLDAARHAAFLDALVKHGLTMTDVITLHIDQIVPVLRKASPIEVPGHKRDKRTKLYQPRYRPAGQERNRMEEK